MCYTYKNGCPHPSPVPTPVKNCQNSGISATRETVFVLMAELVVGNKECHMQSPPTQLLVYQRVAKRQTSTSIGLAVRTKLHKTHVSGTSQNMLQKTHKLSSLT